MKFPVTIDEFDEHSEHFLGEVGRVYDKVQYESAKNIFVNKFPYTYTYTDQTGSVIFD